LKSECDVRNEVILEDIIASKDGMASKQVRAIVRLRHG